MKQTNKYIAFALAGLVAFSSCKKELDLQPIDEFSESVAYLNMTDIKAGVNTAKARYSTYINDMYASALTSDEAKLGTGNAGQGALEYRFQYAADGTSGGSVQAAFPGYYLLIDQVNRVLPKIATVTATTAEEPLRNIYKGQLLALRGIAHYDLLKNYSKNYNPADPLGVAIMTVSNPLIRPSRNTMGDVMAQIETDLADAKALLPDVTPGTFDDLTINKVNIAAFQARIALYKGDYAQAVAYATEVINSGVKPLSSGPQFQAIWTDDTQEEILFRVRFETNSSVGSLWTTTGGTIYIAPSDKLVNSYDANDIRLPAYIGTISTGRCVNKFFASSRGGRIVDIKACRIAEMYLIRAEANAKKAAPDVAAGAADLNLLRSNRIPGYTNQTFGSAAALITAVLEERFKELAFEGFRFYDLKRNNLPVERLSSDASAAWQTLDAGNFRFVYPIPQTEINANPNMVQNDGY
jgi:hypothetical protein